MVSGKNFEYARLICDGNGQMQMGPETARRYEENTDEIAVTVCCITFKHEDLIRTALDSFVMQKTNFKFKVFVGEDCGPDGTADIVREYASKYPDIVVPFIREKNMGAQANLIDLCRNAKSPYIAFCEGDDYWTDEYKLQKQFDYMQNNPDIRICYTKAEIDAPEDWFLRSWYKADKDGKLIFPDCEPYYRSKTNTLTCKDFIKVFPAHTSTLFYRWNYDVEIPDWYYSGIIGDAPLFLMQLGDGKAHMLEDICSVYRRSNVGVYMSESMDEHFLKTRLDHLRWMSGMLSWYSDHQKNYPEQQINDRIIHESANYVRTALENNDSQALEKYFALYPDAAKMSFGAFVKSFEDGESLSRAASPAGYKLITSKRLYKMIFVPYGRMLVFFEKFKAFCKKAVKAVLRIISFFCYWFYSLVPKKKNLWVITSFKARGYMDNAKYFYEYIAENHPEIKIFWLTKDKGVFNELKSKNLPIAKMRSLKGIHLLSRAKIAVTDHNIMSDYSPLYGFNNRIKVVQLWHGVGFKSVGDGKTVKTVQWPGVQYSYDILANANDGVLTRLKKKILYFFKAPHRELFEKYFLFVCPGQERIDTVAKPWNIPEGNCFIAGHPRDILSYSLKPDENKPKILYAPTFRYDERKERELIEGCISHFSEIQALMEKYDGTFAIRLHPHTWRDYSVRLKNSIAGFDRIIIDDVKDIYTSLGTYSAVISDYSSIAMDFALLDRPTVFYCPDLKWFKTSQAGFNIDFENSLPGPLLSTWEQVVPKIEDYIKNPSLDSDLREEKCSYFFDKSKNGPDNSERIVLKIKEKLKLK